MERNRRKTKVGFVTSNKMDKTITVAVEDSVRHSLYGKSVKRTKKFKAHDEEKHIYRASSHSWALKPTKTLSPSITIGLFTNIPSVDNNLSFSSKLISFNLSFSRISL